MARRPATRTPVETRRTTTNGDNLEANNANVRNPTTRTRFSAPSRDEAVRFHRLVQRNKGIEVHNALKALVADYLQNGLPMPEVVRRATILFKDDLELIVGFNRFLYPVQIPVPIQNLRRVRIFANPGDDEQ